MSYSPGDENIGGVLSNCCDAAVRMPDICADCGEHCKPIKPENE